jgi:hypothetical protein
MADSTATLLLRWETDISAVSDSISFLESRFNKLTMALEGLGRAGDLTSLGNLREGFGSFIEPLLTDLDRLQNQLEALHSLRNQLVAGTASSRRIPSGLGLAGQGRFSTREQIDTAVSERELALVEERRGILERTAQISLATVSELERRSENVVGLELQRFDVVRSVEAILRGEGELSSALANRRLQIEQRISQLTEHRADLIAGSLAQAAGPAEALKLEEELRSLQQKELNNKNAIIAADTRILQLQNQLARSQQKSTKAAIEAFQRGGGKQVTVAAVSSDDVKAAVELNEQLEKRRQLHEDLKIVEGVVRKEENRRDKALEGRGLVENVQKIDEELARLEQRLFQTFNVNQVDAVAELDSELQNLIQTLAVQQKSLTEFGVSEEEATAIMQNMAATYADISRRLRVIGAGEGLPAFLDPEVMEEEALRKMPALEQTLVGAFQGFKRRFIATLQFAISGTILFGLTRLGRETIKTAVEVERAFADIATAIQFDVPFERGTAKFRVALESMRRDILSLADEFNILPTEANKAAFVMVSRFQDTGNAMKALRAQLLATKISTIDQAEILRALTAVAETFASATLEVNDNLSLQERLLQRETVAADLYGRALDVATRIQQVWGIEVEDTLEGAARLSEVFRSLGFTMEETAAMSALVGQRLGLSGTSVAEKLARAFGQLETEQTRDALLDIAAASDNLNLSLSDFESGAKAYKALAIQFERLQQLEPRVGQAAVVAIGGRREVDVVATALGTADIQREIVSTANKAAGAAEDRYSFLKGTLVEIIHSIGAQFEELAQNIQALGLLFPLEAFLRVLDKIFDTINGILQFIIRIKNALNTIGTPFGGLGDALAILFAINIALAQTKALMRAIAFTTGLAFGAPGVAAGVKTAVAAQGTRAAAFAARTAATSAALQTVPTIGLTALMIKSSKLLVSVFTKLATVGAGVLVPLATLAIVAKIAHDGIRKMNRILEELEEIKKPDEKRSSELRLEGLSEVEIARQTAFEDLEATLVLQSEAAAGFGQWVNRMGVEYQKFSDNLAQIVFLRRPLFDVFPTREQREMNAVFSDFWTKEVAESRKIFLLAALDALAADDPSPEVAEGIARLRGQVTTTTDSEGLFGFQKYIEILVNNLKHAKDLSDAEIAEIEGSLSGLRDEFGRLPTRARLEGFSLSQRLGALEDFRATVVAIQAQADEAGLTEVLDNATELLEDLDIAILDIANEELANRLRFIDVFSHGETAKLEAEIQALSEHIEKLDFGSEAWLDATLEMHEKLRAKTDILNRDAILAAELQVKLAGSAAAFVSATKKLELLLIQLAVSAHIAKDFPLEAELLQRIADNRLANADEMERYIVAGVRLAGPVSSRLHEIEGQLQALAHAQQTAQGADKLENQLAIRELIAERARLELERTAAFLLLQAGTRDQLLSLQTQLQNLKNELELTGNQFGVNSTEWFEVSLKIAQLEAQLLDTGLQLKDVNRRLGGDITDSFVQAQNDLINILDQMAIPDLGELEKAQLELQRRQLEARVQQEFFTDRMFELGFMFQTGEIGMSAYIGSLRTLLEQVDTTTKQGKEIFLQISNLIDSLVGSISDLAFNIPSQIRLPTLFEIRRAVQGEQLGITYQDNRQQNIVLNVSDAVDLSAALDAIEKVLGVRVSADARRSAVGRRLTVGGF